MRIRKPTMRLTEIGPLYAALRLPVEARTRCGMKTTCDRCGRSIADETFIGGANMKFHEGCLDEQAAELLAKHDAKDAAKR